VPTGVRNICLCVCLCSCLCACLCACLCVCLCRSETVDGQSSTRFKASQLARGSILIYVSSSSIVNHGWIQPLISHVSQDEQLIVVPHADNLLAGVYTCIGEGGEG